VDGSTRHKTGHINGLKAAPAANTSNPKYKHEDVKAQPYGKTAVVNYKLALSETDATGKDSQPQQFRVTVVWVKDGNNWKTAAAYSSLIMPANQNPNQPNKQPTTQTNRPGK
jgi:ketosteroid isomerase-like protein